MWQRNVDDLAAHFQTLTWDLRGHGSSDYPGDATHYSRDHVIDET
jgi:pimeloyl-ACP methyl ester carboxylesterase